MPTEADTCRKFVVPKLQAAGWDNDPHSIAEQRSITDGRIIPVGKGFIRKPPKRVDYLLRYTRDFPLAVVEAKAAYKSVGDGLQQSKTYAEMLGLNSPTRRTAAKSSSTIIQLALRLFGLIFRRQTICGTATVTRMDYMTIQWPNGSSHRSTTQWTKANDTTNKSR